VLAFPDGFAHRNAASLVGLWADKTLSRPEAERLVLALDRLLAGLKVSRAKAAALPSGSAAAGTASASVGPGAKVFTRYGLGVVQAVLAGGGECSVKLDKDVVRWVALPRSLFRSAANPTPGGRVGRAWRCR
jgi:hypothetical protein